MAKSAKGFNVGAYLAVASLRGGDLERMSVRARRVYLQRYLHLIETQIRLLSEQLDNEEGRWPGQVDMSKQHALDAERVASLSSLNYLFAVREVLRTTLDTL